MQQWRNNNAAREEYGHCCGCSLYLAAPHILHWHCSPISTCTNRKRLLFVKINIAADLAIETASWGRIYPREKKDNGHQDFLDELDLLDLFSCWGNSSNFSYIKCSRRMICTGWWTHCSGSQVPQLPCHEQQLKRVSAEQLPSDKHRPGWGCRSTRTKLGSVKWKIVKNDRISNFDFADILLQIDMKCNSVHFTILHGFRVLPNDPKNQTNPDPTKQHPIWPSFWIGSYQFSEYYFVVTECDE